MISGFLEGGWPRVAAHFRVTPLCGVTHYVALRIANRVTGAERRDKSEKINVGC